MIIVISIISLYKFQSDITLDFNVISLNSNVISLRTQM